MNADISVSIHHSVFLNRSVMSNLSIEQQVQHQIHALEQQGIQAVGVLIGHEDWIEFTVQSKVSYTPFGSARKYQPALGGLLLVRVDEMHKVKVVSQAELDEFSRHHQIL